MVVLTANETVNQETEWREQFKKQPVVWSLGAASGGFLIGYLVAAAITNESRSDQSASNYARSESEHRNPTPGAWERLQETEAYDQLHREAAAVGSRLVSELSQTAQEVVLPVAISLLKQWLSGLTSERKGERDSSKAGSAIYSGDRNTT